MESLVVAPEFEYSTLAGRLRALGWQWRREAQVPPTVPGEPEYVVWQSGDEQCRLLYTFNPVIFFRVLQFSGASAAAERQRVASFVPHLNVARVSEHLQAEDIETCLLGLFAARELELFMLLPRVHELSFHDDALVVEFASEVEASLENMLLVRAREAVQEFARSGFDEAPALSFGGAALRRQVLRRAAVTLGGSQLPGLHFLLRTGLSDPDWEVRASAVILAARTGFTAAREQVAATDFAGLDLALIDAGDRELLVLVHEEAVAMLGRQHEPVEPARRHVWRCILKGEDGNFDASFRLVHSLTVPLELEPRDASLPPGVVATDRGFALARSGIPLVRVAPSPCWLGHADGPSEPSNPFRRVVPQKSFFVARGALAANTIARLLNRRESSISEEALELTSAEADQVIEVLAELEGAMIALPRPDQWEIAARGSDGRRYPWGNHRQAEPGASASPWGVAGLDRGVREWVRSAEGQLMTCGGGDGCCSQRHFAEAGGRYALRPVVLSG
ncbi:MAG TPA: hypothetical protein VFU02_01060 [Polyangiaceae bacterium]|nr:hypothetical protein [Polyangiaceae bacterium]